MSLILTQLLKFLACHQVRTLSYFFPALLGYWRLLVFSRDISTVAWVHVNTAAKLWYSKSCDVFWHDHFVCMQLLAAVHYFPTKMCAELHKIVSCTGHRFPPSLLQFFFFFFHSWRLPLCILFLLWHTGPFMGKIGRTQFCALSI